MNKKFFALVLVVVALTISPLTVLASSGTQVFQFRNEPFVWDECFQVANPFPGPAVKLGEDVCVHYVAMNDSTVRMKANGDVEWTLTQHGTAYIHAQDDGELLDTGVFSVQEIVRDDGGDGNCVGSDGQHAWLGKCDAWWKNVDFAEYHWKINGNSLYYFEITVHGAGNYCYSDKDEDSLGPLCK